MWAFAMKVREIAFEYMDEEMMLHAKNQEEKNDC
jgi:hypothetical protein